MPQVFSHRGLDGRYSGQIKSAKAQVFLDALDKLCEEHGVDIDHEDNQGAFILRESRDGSGIGSPVLADTYTKGYWKDV